MIIERVMGFLCSVKEEGKENSTMEDVLNFIDEIKEEFKETPLYHVHCIEPENYFMRGGCGQFYQILKSAFPQAKPYTVHRMGHVVTEIDGVFYDIRGVVLNETLDDLEITPSIMKIITNYAFTLKSYCGWFGPQPGPTAVCYNQALEEMDDEERLEVFKTLQNIEPFFESLYNDYKTNGMKKEWIEEAELIVTYGHGIAAVA